MAKQKKEVAVINFEEFSIAQLPELNGKKEEIKSIIDANPVVEVIDNASYELAKKSRTAVKTLRTGLEKEKKEVNDRIKKNVLEVVANEYDSLIADVKNDENARQEHVTSWEEKKEAERLEKLRLEEERIGKIKSKISVFFMSWSARIGGLQFSDLENFEIEFGETLVNYDKSELQEFEVLFTDSVSNLTYMLSERKSTLVAQENIRLEQIRLAEERKKQEEEAKRVAEEQAKEKAKWEAEQKAIAEKQRIAQEKFQKEKAEFEANKAEVKYQERVKRLIKVGCVFCEEQNGYEKQGYWIHSDDIKVASDELFERELEYAKTPKTIDSPIESTENYHEEDVHEEDVHEIAKSKEEQILQENPDILNWQNIYSVWMSHYSQTHALIGYLEEFYNTPTPKN